MSRVSRMCVEGVWRGVEGVEAVEGASVSRVFREGI